MIFDKFKKSADPSKVIKSLLNFYVLLNFYLNSEKKN